MKDYTILKKRGRAHLKKIPTHVKHLYSSGKEYEALLDGKRKTLEELQDLLYAGQKRAVLILFQGMDTSGKDGAIKHVMSGVNPQGCTVTSFKVPTSHELNHDFLWRVSRALPERGRIGIFNRSYYEEVLVTRVHPELLIAEKLPTGKDHGKDFWKKRYEDIVSYENYLHRQGIEIIKVFIHISKKEQKYRLLQRFDNPNKLWKISESDIHERLFWDQYSDAYEECISNTSTEQCPWYVVPGDDKKNARLMISELIVKRMKKLDLAYPVVSGEEKQNLKKLKAQLEKD
jgi:PPK2 family polyphosphate:nucleotide phosphotransferase